MYQLHDSWITKAARINNDFVLFIEPYSLYYNDIKEVHLTFRNVKNHIKFNAILSKLNLYDHNCFGVRIAEFQLNNSKAIAGNFFYLKIEDEKVIEINCDQIQWSAV